jgi:hypothetical protein
LIKIYGEGRQLAGKPKDFGEEHRGHGRIFIVLKNFSIGSSLASLLISLSIISIMVLV